MLADELFHPYHVVPAAELIPAGTEKTVPVKAHSLMETLAAVGEIFVRFGRGSDTGIQIEDPHQLQRLLESRIQSAAQTEAPIMRSEVNAQFRTAIVGGSGMETPGVREARDRSVRLRDQSGIELQRPGDPSGKLLFGRSLVIICDSGVFHIPAVDLTHRGGISGERGADNDAVHGVRAPKARRVSPSMR